MQPPGEGGNLCVGQAPRAGAGDGHTVVETHRTAVGPLSAHCRHADIGPIENRCANPWRPASGNRWRADSIADSGPPLDQQRFVCREVQFAPVLRSPILAALLHGRYIDAVQL